MLVTIINRHGLHKTSIACGVSIGAVRGWKTKGRLPVAVGKAAKVKRQRYIRGLAKLECKTAAEMRKQLEESE